MFTADSPRKRADHGGRHRTAYRRARSRWSSARTRGSARLGPRVRPNVVRPAAAEWDEREETPWPLIQEAARSASTSSRRSRQFYADETGLCCRSSTRSCSGATPARHGDHGPDARRRRRSSPRHRRAARRAGAAVLRHARRAEGRRVLRLGARRRLRRLPLRRARATTRPRTSGCQRPEGVGDQRRHRQRPRRRRVRRP